jgi:ribosomal protein L40E
MPIPKQIIEKYNIPKEIIKKLNVKICYKCKSTNSINRKFCRNCLYPKLRFRKFIKSKK